MPSKKIRDDLYAAMLAAITDNIGYIYRGRDRQTGPQAGRGTLLMLERRNWARLVRATVTHNGQKRRVVVGGWLLPLGRAALRDEITRRGDDMPARLALPKRHRITPAASPEPTPTRTTTNLLEQATRSLTAIVDPFMLVATGGGRQVKIPF